MDVTLIPLQTLVHPLLGAVGPRDRVLCPDWLAAQMADAGLARVAPAEGVAEGRTQKPSHVGISRPAGRWAGATVVVIASGPSLSDAQLGVAQARVHKEGWKTIAINDNYRRAPWADVLYACDGTWWTHHIKAIRADFKGELWTQEPQAAKRHGLQRCPGQSGKGLGRDVIHFGGNSGYQALNMAYLWGAARMVLLGFDMQRVDGKDHWFGQHPKGLGQRQPYPLWQKNFPELAADLQLAGVQVFNCSQQSALDCFTKLPIEKVPA